MNSIKRVSACLNCPVCVCVQVFVEFGSVRDADQLGVWYSLQKRAFGHKVLRQKIPMRQIDRSKPSES